MLVYSKRFRSNIAWLMVLLFAVALGVMFVFLAGNTAYAAQESTRIAGETAEETSAAISKSAYPNGCKRAIIARSDDFADAMSATGLAGTLDCPIVTTSPDAPSGAMLDEVKRLGADEVYIVGGEAAINMSVEKALTASGVSVDRISGENSWDTSVECAKRIAAEGGNSRGDVIVATSQNFQDALSISSFAFKYGAPIILENDSYGLTDEARSIVSGASGKVYVPGGHAVVPASTVEGLVGANKVVRLAGQSGYDTSNQVATYLVNHGLLETNSVFVATGALATKGVDALSGAVLAGKNGAPILLVSGNSAIEPVDSTIVSGTDSEGTQAFLAAYSGSIKGSIVLGGTVVISSATVTKINDVLNGSVEVEPGSDETQDVSDYEIWHEFLRDRDYLSMNPIFTDGMFDISTLEYAIVDIDQNGCTELIIQMHESPGSVWCISALFAYDGSRICLVTIGDGGVDNQGGNTIYHYGALLYDRANKAICYTPLKPNTYVSMLDVFTFDENMLNFSYEMCRESEDGISYTYSITFAGDAPKYVQEQEYYKRIERFEAIKFIEGKS